MAFAIGLIGVVFGAVFGYLFARSRIVAQYVGDNARLQAQLEERAADDQRSSAQFEKLSNEVLRNNSEQFLKSAEIAFKQLQLEAKGDADQNRLKIEHLFEPMQQNIEKMERDMQQLHAQRKEEWGALGEQIKQMAVTNKQIQTEAAELKTVLRTSTSTRGQWGEMQLRNLLNKAGMLEHCDFVEQQTASDDERRSRADVVMSLPGGYQLAIDAKVPFKAFEEAAGCEPGEQQEELYREHARQMRVAIDGLAKRKYWEMYLPSPGYCVLFVPGEGLLATALMHDPTLWEYAAEKHVFLVAPTTLLPLLRNAALSWQEQRQVENAAEIASAGKELYSRLMTMASRIRTVGKNLGSTVKAFDDMVGTYETRITPAARKLKAFGVGDHDEIIELESLDKHPRALREAEMPALESSNQIVTIETFEEWWGAAEAEG